VAWAERAEPRRRGRFHARPGAGEADLPGRGRGDPAEADTAKLIYILYLVSLIVGLTSIVGLIMAYVNRADAPDWVRSHYRFQIRTFWIGLLYGAVSLITALIVIGIFFGVFTFIWWIVRCAKGLKQIGRGEAYEKPATWLW
jgi:uncharacterized membrane protein